MHRGMLALNRTEMTLAFATGPDSARMSSQSIRSVTRGSLGLNLSDPLQRQNEEVLQVGHLSVPLSKAYLMVHVVSLASSLHYWHAF